MHTLRPQIYAYLLLLPAFVFLVGFTHYPAVATLLDSLMSTPRAGRAGVFVGFNGDGQLHKLLLIVSGAVIGFLIDYIFTGE
jgi:ABC-type sugar transport system permease subunit